MKTYFFPADICLPDFSRVDGLKWATVACDQYTSEPEYWEEAGRLVGDAPSTLRLMLPEAYLDKSESEIPKINDKMRKYLSEGVLQAHPDSMIYLERTQSDGKIRRGLVGAVDLEDYDFHKGSTSLTRATEGTVLERIPPRVEIRRDACLELPHIMVLIDDPCDTVIGNIAKSKDKYEVAYDFELMGGGGHVKAYFVDKDSFDGVNSALGELASDGISKERYGVDAPSLLFAIGDGNHSLATAKTLYEEIKREIGEDAAREHPARYALCELVNLHDSALEFEPIYRVVFGVEPESFYEDLARYTSSLKGTAARQEIDVVWADGERSITVESPCEQLAVGTVQSFLDGYVKLHPEAEVDYIHGVDSTKTLAQRENAVGILFDGMGKDMLYKTVICDGALPRKTFSMGHAADKRFYIECRKIK